MSFLSKNIATNFVFENTVKFQKENILNNTEYSNQKLFLTVGKSDTTYSLERYCLLPHPTSSLLTIVILVKFALVKKLCNTDEKIKMILNYRVLVLG